MCKKFEIARNTVVGFIVNRNNFTYDQLQDKIIENGGVFRVSNTQSLDNYLNTFEQKGFIQYSPAERKFTRLINFKIHK